MDDSWMSWLAIGVGLVLVLGLIATSLKPKAKGKSKQKQRKIKETEMVALVRRRRELNSQLADLAGDQSKSLLQSEARRMRGSASDIAVLEAAVARAERLTDRAELKR